MYDKKMTLEFLKHLSQEQKYALDIAAAIGYLLSGAEIGDVR